MTASYIDLSHARLRAFASGAPAEPCTTHPTTFRSPDLTGPVIYSGDTAFNPDPDGGTRHSHEQILVAEQALVFDAREIQSYPVWSPDYAKVAYTAKDLQWSDVPFPHTAQPVRIAVMDADGSNRRTVFSSLTLTQYVHPTFTFSPDGGTLAFVSAAGEAPNDHIAGLYVVSTDGSGAPELVSADYIYGPPIWSHDGQHVMYSRANYGPSHGSHFARRRADLSAPEEILMDGELYGDNATFHLHPYDPIVVFDYYERTGDSGSTTAPTDRVLGFLNVESPGCLPEFITAEDASWLVGDENAPYSVTLGQPTWSPDGRYVMGAVEYNAPAAPFREWRYVITDRDQTFLRMVDVYGHPAGSTAVPSDAHDLYIGSWKSDASGIVVQIENDWDLGIGEWNFPDGPLTWLYRSDPISGDAPDGYIWSRRAITGIPYQGYWSMDSNPL